MRNTVNNSVFNVHIDKLMLTPYTLMNKIKDSSSLSNPKPHAQPNNKTYVSKLQAPDLTSLSTQSQISQKKLLIVLRALHL